MLQKLSSIHIVRDEREEYCFVFSRHTLAAHTPPAFNRFYKLKNINKKKRTALVEEGIKKNFN